MRDSLPGNSVFDRCLTREDVAERLGVHPRTVTRLIAAGRLQKVPLPGATRITPDEFARFLAGKPISAADDASRNNSSDSGN